MLEGKCKITVRLKCHCMNRNINYVLKNRVEKNFWNDGIHSGINLVKTKKSSVSLLSYLHKVEIVFSLIAATDTPMISPALSVNDEHTAVPVEEIKDDTNVRI